MWGWGKQKPLREQLLEARDKIHRQLEIIAAGSIDYAWQPGTKEELLSALAEINKRLAELDADQAKESGSA